jgi:hypothetical protein
MAKKDEKLTYVSPDTNNSAVLGTLVGPCADIINPTRNGRGYSEDLWEKVFKSEVVKEYFANGGIFGELGHPADRSETDMEKIAVCMKQPPTKDKNGLLTGKWDILDTPNGKILKTLVDYGYKVGISSRGTGDVVADDDGNEQVDGDTYDFQAFDVVLLPAVKAARLTPVMESVGSKTLKQALNEALEKSNDSEKKLMQETLESLKIDYSPLKEVDNIVVADNKDSEKPVEAIDNGSAELIKSLQEAVKSKADLEVKLLELQNKLAVSDAKVGKVEEELSRYKSTTIRLSNLAKETKQLKKTVSVLEEKVSIKSRIIKTQNTKIEKLNESAKGSQIGLNESVSKKDSEITKLNESLTTLRTENTEAVQKIKTLNDSVKELETSKETQKTELTGKLTKAERLIEGYKKIANETVMKYIDSKAMMLGVSSNEIKNRLSETYTVDDIDAVCEDLQSYALNISKLPFSVDRKVKVKVTESKKEFLRPNSGMDDEIDDALLNLANLKK